MAINPFPIERKLFSVNEYEGMIAAGVLGEDDRLELIEGEVVRMSPIGSVHVFIVNRLANLLSMAQRGDGAPNNNLEEILGILSAELKGYTDRLAGVWSTDLAAVNRELERLSLAPLDPGCSKAEGCRLVP